MKQARHLGPISAPPVRSKLVPIGVVLVLFAVEMLVVEVESRWSWLVFFVFLVLPPLVAIVLIANRWLVGLVVLAQGAATAYTLWFWHVDEAEAVGMSALAFPLVQWPILILIALCYLLRNPALPRRGRSGKI